MASLPNCLSPHPEGPFTLFNPYLTHTVLGLKLFTALILSGPGEAAGAQVLGQPGLPRAASFPSAFSGPESGFLHKRSGWAQALASPPILQWRWRSSQSLLQLALGRPRCETRRKPPSRASFLSTCACPWVQVRKRRCGPVPSLLGAGGFLSAFVLTWRHLEACRGLAPSKTPLFLRELLTWHLFIFGWVWGAGKGGVTDREQAALPAAASAASSAEEGSFLLLLKPGKGWGFSASSSHCCFLCPRLVSWSSQSGPWRGECISRTWCLSHSG